MDCFCAAIPDPVTRELFAEQIASYLNLSSAVSSEYCNRYKPEVSLSPSLIRVGKRVSLKRLPALVRLTGSVASTPFSFTRKSCVLLERVGVAVTNNEPVLIVGETGTGKTTAVQYLARQLNQKLKVINMNQQSDATDLLGGFKPVQMRTIMFPLRDEFEGLFSATFPDKMKFLRHVSNSYGRNDWKLLLDLMVETEKKAMIVVKNMSSDLTLKLKKLEEEESKNETSAKKQRRSKKSRAPDDKLEEKEEVVEKLKQNSLLMSQWEELKGKLEQARGHVEKSKSALAFSFIEGALTKAIVEGILF